MIFVSHDGNDCQALVHSAIADNSFALLDPKKKDQGFLLAPKQEEAPSFHVEIECDEAKTTPEYTPYQKRLRIASRSACGTFNEPARFLFKNKEAVSLAFMAIGLVLLVFGGRMWEALLLFSSFLLGFLVALSVSWHFTQFESSTKTYTLIFCLATLVEVVFTIFCLMFDHFSHFNIGFHGGYALYEFILITFPRWPSTISLSGTCQRSLE